MFKGFRNRRPWAAALVSLFLGPFVGMLYLGRGKFAVAYLCAGILAVSIALGLFPSLITGFYPNSLSLAFLPITLIGVVHSVVIAMHRQADEKQKWYTHWYSIAAVAGGIPLLLAIVVRTFFYQTFDIPSVSMSPSLNLGDYFFVSKRAYDRVSPQRGDIVVFRVPQFGNISYVKRIVGLPGDRVQMRGGLLYINGIASPQKRVRDFEEKCDNGAVCRVPQFAETLPGGRVDYVLDRDPSGPGDNTDVFLVPPGNYFVLGDNRDNSADSRNTVGYVQAGNIVGQAAIRFMAGGKWVWQTIN